MTFHKPAEMKETFMAPKKQIITASKPNVSSNIKEKPQSSSCLRLPKQDLHPCKDCGRKFLLEALQRHEKICKKVFQSKRK